MRIQSSRASLLLSAFFSGLGLVSADAFKCDQIKAADHTFDLSGLKGAHEVSYTSENQTDNYVVSTTYVMNICDVLHSAANRDGEKCGTDKNICGFPKTHAKDDHGNETFAYPVADLVGEGEKAPLATPLKEIDEKKEGLRLKMFGGEYRAHVEGETKPAAAIIDFQCDPDRSGLEGIVSTEDILEKGDAKEKDNANAKRAEDKSESEKDPSLKIVSFGPDKDNTYILKLDWKTRYACYDYKGGNAGNTDPSKHWGFFTWMIIILFLAIAAYLIFGSWLNYNRFGARGWDLLPHGDTLRDVPYIFQDWFRRVVNTLQGGGSRGGYSAV
ncbi:hypothetical protein N7478_012295 [Penicillium angulare]|uniref:uncharacterized protein n=1 Tax=Penicillium angulare TaxID=116970 RepID=UPI00253FEF99|nr:uncharacterized protein N7478_012295 [Penicillium angulare]KAJ5259314.1 hypothetical protein N7478_012295 [Penicillium angulare]